VGKNTFYSRNALCYQLRCRLGGHRIGSTQGDQIGQIFAQWALLLWAIFKIINEVAQILGLLFYPVL
jgi:hypothetical protein